MLAALRGQGIKSVPRGVLMSEKERVGSTAVSSLRDQEVTSYLEE